MNGWIIRTAEGVIEQQAQPISEAEIADEELRADDVFVALHWVEQGTYTDDAVEIDVLILADDAAVQHVDDVFEQLYARSRDLGRSTLTAYVNVDDEIMQSQGWSKSSSWSITDLNVFSDEQWWEKDLSATSQGAKKSSETHNAYGN